MPTIKELVQKEAEAFEKARKIKKSAEKAAAQIIETSEASKRSPTVA